MTLLELLVKELPKRGGWPNGAHYLSSNGQGRVFAYWDGASTKGRDLNIITSVEGVVTLEQYKAALAESQKVEWDGVGLPPVGIDFEMRYGEGAWRKARLIAHGEEQIIFRYEGEMEFSGHRNNYQFRPIRSEADKKRDVITKEMCEVYRNSLGDGIAAMGCLYDSIVAGKIPGVRIE